MILKAYHRWGTACVERFYGMFAFALVERATRRLVLARDRLGIKPLYLAEGAGPGAVRLDPAGAARRRRRGHRPRPGGAAPLHDLPLGGAAAAHDPRRGPEAAAGYRAGDRAATDRSTDTALLAAARSTAAAVARDVRRRVAGASSSAALRTAVERRMVADVPVGVLLSGGIDSSLIVALLAERARPAWRPSASGSRRRAGRGDEFAYSDLVASEFDTDHHQIRIGAEAAACPRVDAADRAR